MLEAGAPMPAIMIAVSAVEQAQNQCAELLEAQRSSVRERVKKHRENKASNQCNVTVTLQKRDSNVTVTSREHVYAGSNTLSSEPKGSSEVIERKEEREETRVTALAPSEFEDFWKLYPNKVGKPKAKTSFSQARKRADLQTIMDGLQRYVGKTDDRPWCNPTTFLNQDRWGDEPAQVPVSRQGSPPEGRRTPSHALMEMATGTGKYANLFKRRNDETDFSASSEFPRLISG